MRRRESVLEACLAVDGASILGLTYSHLPHAQPAFCSICEQFQFANWSARFISCAVYRLDVPAAKTLSHSQTVLLWQRSPAPGTARSPVRSFCKSARKVQFPPCPSSPPV